MSHYAKTFKDLIVKKEGNLLWVTLDNPKASNAITDHMIDSLESILAIAECDQEVRVLIVAGSGKNFCAGGDLNAMENKTGMFEGESFELGINYKHGIQRISRSFERFQKPLIAMVNGAAIGAGCDLSCMCDIRLGSESSKFGETFAKLGLVPGDGGTFFLQRVVGYSKAMEMILTCDIYNAFEAKEMGLLNQVYKDEELAIKTKEMAIKISKNAPIGLSLSKRALKMARTQDLESNLEVLSFYQGVAQRTEDHFEGVKAIKSKTSPVFKGQ